MTMIPLLRYGVSTLSFGLGVALLTLPNRWIEAATGLDPDFGSGSLEFALAFGALATGVLLVWEPLRQIRVRAAIRRA